MADSTNTPPQTLPLSRIYELEKLPANRVIKFDFAPNLTEQEAIKTQLGLSGLKKMRFAGQILPDGARSWRLEAVLGATVSQLCVISAEPVRTRIDASVQIKFVPQDQIPQNTPEDELDETLEPFEGAIDIGAIATEALSLEMPLYPKKQGAEMQNSQATPNGEAPITDAAVKPFAALDVLKQKLEDKSE